MDAAPIIKDALHDGRRVNVSPGAKKASGVDAASGDTRDTPGSAIWGSTRDPRGPDDPPDLARASLARMAGWVVNGLTPLVALAMALTQGGGPLADLASRIMGVPAGSARVADIYGLIILALTAVTLAIWGLWPALLALGEGALGLSVIISTRHITPAALGGWLVAHTALAAALAAALAVALAALAAVTARLEWTKREVARLRQGMARERARIDAALDVTPDALAFYDSSGRLMRLNQEARRLLVAPSLDGAGVEDAPRATWMRDGQALAREDWPDTRALRGEVVREEALALSAGGEGWPGVVAGGVGVGGADPGAGWRDRGGGGVATGCERGG